MYRFSRLTCVRRYALKRFSAVLGIAAAALLASCGGGDNPGETLSPKAEARTAPLGVASDEASNAADPSAGAPPPGEFWEALCNRQLGRAERCGETVRFDSLDECLNDRYERACNELLDARSAAMVIDLLKQAPCRPGSPVLADAPGGILDALELSGEEKAAQDACLESMQSCPTEGTDRCIAPMLKQPYRRRVFDCYARGCRNIRQCTETVLEEGGCP